MTAHHSTSIHVYEPQPVWTHRLARESTVGDWQFRWRPWDESAEEGDASIVILAPPPEQAWGAECARHLEKTSLGCRYLLLAEVDGMLELTLRDLGLHSILPTSASAFTVLRMLRHWRSSTHESTQLWKSR